MKQARLERPPQDDAWTDIWKSSRNQLLDTPPSSLIFRAASRPDLPAKPPPLLPAQEKALEDIERELGAHGTAVLAGRPGAGKTTILK
ncbi:MAG TPA: hypothetical protein VGP40_08695, partial [Chthoniobacterales bacterium]|nr:hypothetical protein [Chthoniobacterales bacterium]